MNFRPLLARHTGNDIVPGGRNVTVQSISGTGALRVGAAFLANWFPGNKVSEWGEEWEKGYRRRGGHQLE